MKIWGLASVAAAATSLAAVSVAAAPDDLAPRETDAPIAMAQPNEAAVLNGGAQPAMLTPTTLTPPELSTPPEAPRVTGFAALILEALETTAPLEAGNAGAPTAAAVRGFYAARKFEPVWTDRNGPLPRAHSLRAAVQAAQADGLEPWDYVTGSVDQLFASRSEAELARLEAALTWAYVRLASDLASGRTVPNEVDPEHFVHPHDVEPAEALANAAKRHDIHTLVAGYAPQTAEYRKLKAALATYREIARLGGWTQMSDGPIMRPGDRSPRVAELRRVLAERGEAISETAEDPNRYDQDVKAAVRGFQERHGLHPDGRFGPATLRALNMTAERRIEQIKINMERRRWMPDDLGVRYAFVNLADFRLRVVFHDEPVFETRVVVGTAADRTPVFSDRMTYLVINPYWNIPPSIAGEEMLPQLRKDPLSLAAKGIRVFSGWAAGAVEIDPTTIDWNMVSSRRFPFKLRQDPGDQNALGRVKFMFPNQFNIYLHDTPSKSLFERTVRTFSHGCIRVEDPLRLARLLLAEDPNWPPERIDEQLASNERRTITLPHALNVHLTYLTAWVDDDGVVQFRNDIYKRDRRLISALDASRESPALAQSDDDVTATTR